MPTLNTDPFSRIGPLSHPLRTLPVVTLLLGGCLRAPAPSGEPSPLITDRPDFTESAVTVPHQATQVEMGATYAWEGGVTSVSSGETLIRRGLTPRVELRVTTASYAFERAGALSTRGFEDAGIGFKFALHDAGEGRSVIPTVGLIAGTSLPSGSSAFRSARALPEAKLLTSWTLSDRVGFAANLNWARAEAGPSAHDEYSGSGSFALSLSDRVGAYAEYFAFGERIAGWQRREYANGGVTYLITPAFQLDVRAGVRLDGRTDGAFYGVGVSRLF